MELLHMGWSYQKYLPQDKKSHWHTLGQITSYTAAQLGSQFYTQIYFVLIVHDQARILCLDMSGTIMMEAIPYNESPLLINFSQHYSQAPLKMCGIDQSVSDPTPEEELTARKILQVDDNINKCCDALLEAKVWDKTRKKIITEMHAIIVLANIYTQATCRGSSIPKSKNKTKRAQNHWWVTERQVLHGRWLLCFVCGGWLTTKEWGGCSEWKGGVKTKPCQGIGCMDQNKWGHQTEKQGQEGSICWCS